MRRWLWSLTLVGLLAGVGGRTVTEAQPGPYAALIQQALRTFLTEAHTWTALQTFSGGLAFAGGTLTGHLLFSPDRTYDIGAAGATRPRTGYFGTSIVQGGALALGTTTTAGVTLQNTTAAAAGAQQYSPGLSFIGRGWKTNATAASQPVETRFELRPVQGAAAPTYTFALLGRVNVGAWGDLLTVSSSGSLAPLGAVALPAAQYIGWQGRGSLWSPADGQVQVQTNAGTSQANLSTSLTGGVALASHAISLADHGTSKIAAAPVAMLTVTDDTDAYVCQYALHGTGAVALIHDDASTKCTVTKDNDTTINCYYDTDGVYCQNELGGTKSFRFTRQGT